MDKVPAVPNMREVDCRAPAVAVLDMQAAVLDTPTAVSDRQLAEWDTLLLAYWNLLINISSKLHYRHSKYPADSEETRVR